jgi:hypothetical protein
LLKAIDLVSPRFLMLSSEVIILIAMLNIYRILHTAREKRTTEKDRTDYVFIKQEQYEEDVTKVC